MKNYFTDEDNNRYKIVTEAEAVATKTRRLKPITYSADLHGRSTLVNLTKLEIAQGILDANPSFGFAQITAHLSADKSIRRSTKLYISRAQERGVKLIDALMQLTREVLVKMTYDLSDSRLNNLYWKKSQIHQTTEDADRDEIDWKFGYVLKDKRAIDIGDLSLWKPSRKKTPKPAAKAKTERKPVSKKDSVKKTVNWIAAMKEHNAFLAHKA